MNNRLLKIFFPPRCTFCRRVLPFESSKFICESCEQKLPSPAKNACRLCGGELASEFALPVCGMCRKYRHSFSGAFVPLRYTGAARSALLRFKFSGRAAYAKTFAFLIAQSYFGRENPPRLDSITFVPQGKDSARTREYCPTGLLAKELSKILSIPCAPALKRLPSCKRQSRLNAAQRRENVRRGYEVLKGAEISGSVLLVDDIYTTGATADRCSRLLKKMGAQKVFLGIAAINNFLR